MRIALALALAVLFFGSLTRADSFVEINGQNIILGGETLNFTMQADLTTATLVPGTTNFVWSGALNGTPFILAPQCSSTSVGLCSDGVSLLNWSSPTAELQLGIFDNSLELGGPNVDLFPAVGIYSATLFDITCAFLSPCFFDVGGGFVEGLGPSADGQIVVTAIPGPVGTPEPSSLLLSVLGVVALIALARR